MEITWKGIRKANKNMLIKSIIFLICSLNSIFAQTLYTVFGSPGNEMEFYFEKKWVHSFEEAQSYCRKQGAVVGNVKLKEYLPHILSSMRKLKCVNRWFYVGAVVQPNGQISWIDQLGGTPHFVIDQYVFFQNRTIPNRGENCLAISTETHPNNFLFFSFLSCNQASYVFCTKLKDDLQVASGVKPQPALIEKRQANGAAINPVNEIELNISDITSFVPLKARINTLLFTRWIDLTLLFGGLISLTAYLTIHSLINGWKVVYYCGLSEKLKELNQQISNEKSTPESRQIMQNQIPAQYDIPQQMGYYPYQAPPMPTQMYPQMMPQHVMYQY